MTAALSWPLDSPISLGIAICFLFVFLVGLTYNLNPNLLRLGRPGSSTDRAYDKRMGLTLMQIFGPLSIAMMMLSWVRSNNARYAFLDKDD